MPIAAILQITLPTTWSSSKVVDCKVYDGARGDEDGTLTVDQAGLLNDNTGSTTLLHFTARILFAGYRSLIGLMTAVELWAADPQPSSGCREANGCKNLADRARDDAGGEGNRGDGQLQVDVSSGSP